MFFLLFFFNRLKNKLLKMRSFILVCLMIVAAATAIEGKKNIFFSVKNFSFNRETECLSLKKKSSD